MPDFIRPPASGSLDEFVARFPEWVLGEGVWRRWIDEGRWREGGAGALDELIDDLRRLAAPPPTCPRVFVSHRRSDAAEALRIAELANASGFEFWLDVLDPKLQWLTAT